MNKTITTALAELAHKLGLLVPQLYAWSYQRAIVTTIETLIGLLTAVVATSVIFSWLLREYREGEDDEYLGAAIISGMLGIGFVIMFLCTLPDLFSLHYLALQQLVSLVSH